MHFISVEVDLDGSQRHGAVALLRTPRCGGEGRVGRCDIVLYWRSCCAVRMNARSLGGDVCGLVVACEGHICRAMEVEVCVTTGCVHSGLEVA